VEVKCTNFSKIHVEICLYEFARARQSRDRAVPARVAGSEYNTGTESVFVKFGTDRPSRLAAYSGQAILENTHVYIYPWSLIL
jgi:hypothetical protein